MKQIDIFKLADKLGFDVRGGILKDSIDSIMLIDENVDCIPGFYKNKIICYNVKKHIETKKRSVAIHIFNYLNLKKDNNKIKCYYEINNNTDKNIDINIDYTMLLNECIKKEFVKKNEVKKLYKKMHK